MPLTMENDYCGLISNEENLQVFKLIGNRCQSLCTAVVQLYYTQPPYHSDWLKKGTGVLCFIKDNTKRNFFFRLYCLRQNTKLWEQEMYNNIEYLEATSFFSRHDCMWFIKKIQARRRREEKRSRQINHSQTIPGPTVDLSGFKKTPDPAAKLAKRKRNITKADISTPMDFKHISHVGWNSASGFDINTEDEELKEFFKKVSSTREFLYDFVNTHGGRDAVVKSTAKAAPPETNTPPPAVPPRGPARGPHFRNAPPPPIPAKSNNVTNRKSRPAEIPRKPAPTPTPTPAPPAPPPPPPPPPPMEMPESNAEVRSTVPPPPPPPSDTGNSALLQSIRNGTTLKVFDKDKSLNISQRHGFGLT
ncbi:hypothetical protein NQ317_007971 [Molorchus minor]|uniref:Wiskott-Aldrich syndrome protein n=1 Tax=Molorchus minor TaxID=1323400 RepID=A0ABQ9JJR3_9CUCU|nr:hypothetical protein NQ317_007971 [Molorchus minor]